MQAGTVRLGIKENWKQFTLLVIVNALVGGMIGMERSIFPQFALQEFGISSNAAMLGFIVAFGITKALANYFTGLLANRYGRKNLLIIGWFFAIPVPLILINADSWSWVILANILLGISQGFTWSSTVVMKIDLVGERNRGLAMGLNEFAGYAAVGLVAYFTAQIVQIYGLIPYPFYLGLFIAIAGFLLSIFWVRDTRMHVMSESVAINSAPLKQVFIDTSFRIRTLSAVTQAGLVNNMNDGMIWGLLPVLLLSLNFSQTQLGIVTAIYPLVWGIGQLFTGTMADLFSKKSMLFWGMLIQGVAILFIPLTGNYFFLIVLSSLLGIGTALVYPTFMTTIAMATNPTQRAESLGVFRLWRDLGYAIGAILSGITADAFGVPAAIVLIGVLTIASSIVIRIRMDNQ
jgi:MFS family permease